MTGLLGHERRLLGEEPRLVLRRSCKHGQVAACAWVTWGHLRRLIHPVDVHGHAGPRRQVSAWLKPVVRRLGRVLLARSSVHKEGGRSREGVACAAIQSNLGSSHEPVILLRYLAGSLTGAIVSIQARVGVERRHHHATYDWILLLLVAPDEWLIVSNGGYCAMLLLLHPIIVVVKQLLLRLVLINYKALPTSSLVEILTSWQELAAHTSATTGVYFTALQLCLGLLLLRLFIKSANLIICSLLVRVLEVIVDRPVWLLFRHVGVGRHDGAIFVVLWLGVTELRSILLKIWIIQLNQSQNG